MLSLRLFHHFSDAGCYSSCDLQDVSLSGDSLANIRVRENHTELVTDSVVSQGWHRESERELKPWKPDDEFYDPTSTSLSNTWR